jgi:quercetin dioxygenase-like cupin family protein
MAVKEHRIGARRTKRLLMPLALVAAPALATTAVAAGYHGAESGSARVAGPVGVTIEPLAHATLPARVRAHGEGITISTKGPRDMLATSITVAPGGTFGWHTHPGPVLVAVANGTLSLYEAHHGGCRTRRVTAGQGFVEGGGDVHLANNEGTAPVRIVATFLARTGTSEFLTTVPDPGTCRISR